MIAYEKYRTRNKIPVLFKKEHKIRVKSKVNYCTYNKYTVYNVVS